MISQDANDAKAPFNVLQMPWEASKTENDKLVEKALSTKGIRPPSLPNVSNGYIRAIDNVRSVLPTAPLAATMRLAMKCAEHPTQNVSIAHSMAMLFGDRIVFEGNRVLKWNGHSFLDSSNELLYQLLQFSFVELLKEESRMLSSVRDCRRKRTRFLYNADYELVYIGRERVRHTRLPICARVDSCTAAESARATHPSNR